MKRTITIAILVGLMAALCISSAMAATIRVDGLNGVDDAQHNGSTWALAKQTIGAAITAAATNDEIWVRGKGTVNNTTFDGVYVEQITLNKVVKLYGGFLGDEATRSARGFYPPFGPSQYLYETTIDGNSSGSVVTLQSGATSATIIDGFTIRNGSSYGVNCGTYSPQVTHNLIEHNGGSGVYSSSGTPAVKYNLIQGNAGDGVTCGTYSSAIVSVNIIRGNVEAGVSSSSSGGITANFVSGNRTSGISISGSQVVDSNTIAGNAGQSMSSQFGSPTIRNNIVAYNTNGVNHMGTGTPALTYNCVYGNAAYQYAAGLTPGTGSISSDPKLGSVIYGELHIKSDSPCVNTAYVGGTPSVDIDGDYRPPILPRNIGADFFFPATPPTYDGNPTVTVMVDGGMGDDGNDGFSWGAAKETVQAGIDAAARWGGDVWVKSWVYDECIVLQSHAQVYGGFAGDETSREDRDWRTNATTIDGASGELESLSAVYVQTGHLVSRIDGFTITNGMAQMGAGVLCYYASAYVSNNTIEDNGGAVTMTGGGYESYGTYCEVSNNIIRSNTATDYGSAILIFNSADTIYNNLIYGNTTEDVAGAVGIFASNLSPTLVNNTIVDNENDGIYVNGWDSPTQDGDIINNIVAGNSGYGIHSDGQIDPVLSHNDVPDDGLGDYEGISAGTGDISSDPLFADQQNGDYHIVETSPCVDTGYDSAVVSGSLDIDTQPRQVEIPDKGTAETLVDIGADEWYPDYDEDPMVDNGLPPSDLYNADGDDRCNIRWADSNSGVGYGGSFTFLEGPAWQIDEITVWTVPDMPMYPTYYLGDLYSNVSLYLGTTTLGTGPAMSGTFTAGANATNNNNISVEAAQYGGTTDYEDFDGTSSKLWKITFTNVNWTAPANTTIHFGVHGIPRVDRLWFNHATEGSGTLYKYSTTTSPVMFIPAEGSGWFYDKDTSINVQVKAHPVLQ